MKKRKQQKGRITGFVAILGILLAIASLLGFLGRIYWGFDLFSHFRVQYMQLCLILVGITLWKRQHKQSVALVLLVALNYSFVLPFYFGKPSAPENPPLRAMLMNLNASNEDTGAVLESIRVADPDLVLLEEVTPRWAQDLSILNASYPHRIAEPQDGCFGIMLLSKYPLRGQILEIGMAGVPSIVTEVYLPSGTISLIGTHPVPSIGAQYAHERNVQLKELSKYVGLQKYPVLLMGDLNASPWSPHFRDLLSEANLKDSMKGFGFQPTWPSDSPFLRIPLDHVLYSEGIRVHDRVVGRKVGSDHLPVIVDFTTSP